jgi:hypothetical protein
MSTRRSLFVTIHSAQDLIACDTRGGSSNPYLVVSLLDLAHRPIKNEKQISSVKEKTLKPKYEQRLTLGRYSNFLRLNSLPQVNIMI